MNWIKEFLYFEEFFFNSDYSGTSFLSLAALVGLDLLSFFFYGLGGEVLGLGPALA